MNLFIKVVSAWIVIGVAGYWQAYYFARSGAQDSVFNIFTLKGVLTIIGGIIVGYGLYLS